MPCELRLLTQVNRPPILRRMKKESKKIKGREPFVGFRAPRAMLKRIDKMAAELSSRSAAVRFLVARGLENAR